MKREMIIASTATNKLSCCGSNSNIDGIIRSVLLMVGHWQSLRKNLWLMINKIQNQFISCA